MSKTLVVYYSKNGSNKYLAERFAKELNADIELIRPRLNAMFLLIMGSWLKLSWGIKAVSKNVKEYDHIVLCGPIWIGNFISPLRSFVKKYRKDINQLYFATCCGSKDDTKDDTFGYGLVFKKVEKVYGKDSLTCQAFPIDLVIPEDKKEDDELIMKTRLNDGNFEGPILQRFEEFLTLVRQ